MISNNFISLCRSPRFSLAVWRLSEGKRCEITEMPEEKKRKKVSQSFFLFPY